MNEPDKFKPKEFNPKLFQRAKQEKVGRLSDYKENYDSQTFIKDLTSYFDNEVDFNLEKIHQEIEKPGRLSGLIKKAKQKNTHPVAEFIQDLFQDLGQSGDVEWSGDW